MDLNLKALLARNQIHGDISEKLEQEGCTSVDLFAEWVLTDPELLAAWLTPTSQKDSMPQRARLRLAWKQAKAASEKKIKRASDGFPEDDNDDPLDSGIQTSLEEQWCKAWSWPMLPPNRIAADEILGRFYREFQRGKPTLFPISRLKTLATAQKTNAPKRRKVAPGLELMLDGDVDDDHVGGTILNLLASYDVMANTWSLAGVFEVTIDAKTERYAPWPECIAYVADIKNRITPLETYFTETSIAIFVENREEALRLKMIEMVRGERKLSWGNALKLVRTEFNHLWQDERDILKPIGGSSASSNPSSAPSGTKGPKGKGKGSKGKGDKDKDGRDQGKGSKDKGPNAPGTSVRRWATVAKDWTNKPSVRNITTSARALRRV